MKQILALLLLYSLAACQPDVPTIQGFDPYVWKRDKYGCGQERIAMADTVIAQRDLLVQLKERELMRILGSPDARELYLRNQKFLIYFLEPNPRCTAAANAPTKAKALFIRMNALGKANEVYLGTF